MNTISTHILNLISAYTTKEINETEFNELQTWLNQSSENRQLFSDYLKFYKKSRRISLRVVMDKEKAWTQILSKLENPFMPTKKRMTFNMHSFRENWMRYSAAAVLVLALASTYFLRDGLFNNSIENNTPLIVNNQIVPGVEKATLTLEDGTKVTLEKGDSIQTHNAISNGEEIIYNNNTSRQLVYNYLTIPRGGQFQLTLSDGTRVWLNSETQLKYPVSFTDSESRQVELVYGEAYFEVSHSTEHKGSDFKVYNQNQDVQVLGTEFNIKAYKDESNIYTTLVSGKVAINTESTKQVLVPNQQANLDLTTDKLSIKNIDIKGEIAWIHGEFIVKNKSLKEIMKVLSRWYDMDVTFANKELENVRFVGVLGKDQNIVDILNTIKSFGVINNYEINNKKVILK
ncbi:FecR family protein [Gelidibacter japonicus]|uniref:FecR family protein n=1 Tax=Gelidibacter japonicus TaxID=1962232 RepID=UPI002AFF68E6|nr:FecR domain-containing protein [Gelidibacter japonicus]